MADEEELYSLEQVAERIFLEGDLCYCILHWFKADQIADPKLRELWREARRVLDEIESILEPYSDELEYGGS